MLGNRKEKTYEGSGLRNKPRENLGEDVERI
jgi:hypothetical protein